MSPEQPKGRAELSALSALKALHWFSPRKHEVVMLAVGVEGTAAQGAWVSPPGTCGLSDRPGLTPSSG